MLNMNVINDWTSEYGEIPDDLKIEAKACFITGFAEWRLEQDCGPDDDDEDLWETYLQSIEDNIGTMGVFEAILVTYIQLNKLKAAFSDVYMNGDEEYHLIVYQVVPKTTEDLQELIEVFAEAKNIPLPEVFADRIISELR